MLKVAKVIFFKALCCVSDLVFRKATRLSKPFRSEQDNVDS